MGMLTAYGDTRDWVGAVHPHTPQSLFLEKSDQKTRHAPFGQIPSNCPFYAAAGTIRVTEVFIGCSFVCWL